MFDLSIVIITYNRSNYLQRLLESLSKSVFKDCEIWVLNNASTDNTLQVCEEYKQIIKNLNIVTHQFNIGADANILRAYEYGDKYYKWILCDDDILHFDKMEDLLDVLKTKKSDLIRIGDAGVIQEERGKSSTLGELLHDKQSMTFYSLGFVPNIIFRNVVAPHVQYTYPKIHTRYQQLFVLMKTFNMETIMYTTKEPLLTRGNAPTGIGSEILLYQIRSLEALPTKKSRKNAMGWRSKHQKFLLYVFGYGWLILVDIKDGRPRREIFKIAVETILAAPALSGKFILTLNSFFILFPKKILYFLIQVRKKRKMQI